MTNGAVAAGHEVTAGAAADILRAGGNAFDAAIAGLFAACVAEPVLASPGGGGFLLGRDAAGTTGPVVYDFFAHTPRAKRPAGDVEFHPIHADFGTATQEFHIGHGACAAPGFIPGLFDVHRRHGSMPMAELLRPAIAAARDGVKITRFQAYLLSVVQPIYTASAAARDVFAPGGKLLAEGDTLRNPDLASTLSALADEGEGLATEGDLAALMARACAEGGHLTRDDFAAYRVHEGAPLTVAHSDARVHLNPPPSSGGILIAFALDLVAATGATAPATLASALAATGEARRREGISARLLDTALVERYAAEVAERPKSFRGTTHLSVIDGNGNAAAATVSNGEGCGHLVPGAGYMLNNMLGEEDINPTGFGNWPEDTRLSSMMAPTLIERADGGLCVLGTGGSNRIRSAIFQTVVQLVDLGLTPEQAVAMPRLHVEGELLSFEDFFEPADREALTAMFPEHQAWEERSLFFGGVHLVERDADGSLSGAGDPRRAGVFVRT